MRTAVIVLSVALSGCSKSFFYAPVVSPPAPQPMQYDMPLVSVERRPQAEAAGVLRADSVSVYEAPGVRILVAPVRGVFSLAVENRGDQTMNLVWDRAAYVGPDGASGRVSPSGPRIAEIGVSQPPTVIPASSRAEVTVVPHALYIQDDFLTHPYRDFVPVADGAAESFQGKAVRLVLPLEAQGVVHEYTFVFRLENVRYPWADPACNAERYRRQECR